MATKSGTSVLSNRRLLIATRTGKIHSLKILWRTLSPLTPCKFDSLLKRCFVTRDLMRRIEDNSNPEWVSWTRTKRIETILEALNGELLRSVKKGKIRCVICNLRFRFVKFENGSLAILLDKYERS